MKAISERIRLLFGPISIVCLWFGTYVGPGFASGSLQTSFLLSTGWAGVIIGPTIICFVTAAIVYFVLEYARRFELYNYRDFYDKVYGKYSVLFANFKDIAMILSAVVISSMVTALGGSLLSSILPLTTGACSFLTALIVVILVMFGRDVVRNTTAVITIAMISMLIYLIGVGIGSSWDKMLVYTGAHTMNMSWPAAIWKFIVYSNFFLTFTDAAYPQIKGVLNSKKDVALTVGIGLVLNILCTLGTTIILAAGMPDIQTASVPMMWVLENLISSGSSIRLLYVLISYFALLSTIVGWMYSFVERYDRIMAKFMGKVRPQVRRTGLLVLLMGLAIMLSGFGVLAIVDKGYSLVSLTSVPVFFLPFLVILPYQMRKADQVKTAAGEELQKGDT